MLLKDTYNKLMNILKQPILLFLLFFVNLVGSIYGFYWYQQQLTVTPSIFKIFVPDSPTASAFFTIALFLIIIKKPKPFMMLVACAWLIKYGLWAVIINTHFYLIGGNYTFTNFHLSLSHLGMAIEGFLFINEVYFKKGYILTLTILMLINDIIDYKLGIHPWLFAQSQWGIALISVISLTVLICIYCIFLYGKRS
ncbi:MAG: DUF1405 domain-containing protein [Tepidanaerobacteraceae bacterium]|nr:DUF1405 domain-containing protein [Tepidanaerobacteraceae bacterium]